MTRYKKLIQTRLRDAGNLIRALKLTSYEIRSFSVYGNDLSNGSFSVEKEALIRVFHLLRVKRDNVQINRHGGDEKCEFISVAFEAEGFDWHTFMSPDEAKELLNKAEARSIEQRVKRVCGTQEPALTYVPFKRLD